MSDRDLNSRVGADVAEVTVSEDALRNFPMFLKFIEEHGQVKVRGAIKVRLEQSSVRKTSLNELLSRLLMDKTAPDMQQFFSSDHLVYGYVSSNPDAEDVHNFLSKANDPATYSEESCCSSMLAVLGEEALFDHYWKILHVYAGIVLNQKACITEEVEHLLAQRENLLAKYYEPNQHAQDVPLSSKADPAHNRCSGLLNNTLCNCCEDSENLESDEKEVTIQYNAKRGENILYGAGIQIKGTPIEIFSGFTLSRLNSILDLHPVKYPGLSSPYFYVGSTHSSFVAHIEDASLWSINFLHYGHCKVWFVIPPEFVGLVDFYLSQVRLHLSHTACSNILGHKHAMLTQQFLVKHSIPHSKIIQKPGEFVILYPNAIHFGFNMGNNVAEAVNFATESWILYGLTAPRCLCFGPQQIHLDMTPFLVAFQPGQLRTYLEGGNLLPPDQHPFSVVSFKSAAASLTDKDENNQATGKTEVLCLNSKDELHSQHQLKISRNKLGVPCKNMLQCPACIQSYKGGVGRLNRLLKQIKKQHPSQLDKLQQLTLEKYKTKEPNQKRNQCPICNKLLSGSAFHLRDHMRRMHHSH